MQDLEEITMPHLINCMVKANQKISHNYFKNNPGYHDSVQDLVATYTDLFTKIWTNPTELNKIAGFNLDFITAQQDVWKNICFGFNSETKPVIEPLKGDKRFLDDEWNNNPYFSFIKQSYLLAEKLSQQIIDETNMDNKTRKKINFCTGQIMDAFSPSNFLLTNPEALKLAAETKGKSLLDGLKNLVRDLEKGEVTQTDETAFTIGENLGITPGTIIFQNELIQLIQYTPTTKKVHEIPLIIIPPCINKYYVLDLQPKNSFVKFLVESGVTVFMVSWRNPKSGMSHITFDDYVSKGVLKAIEVAKNISSAKKVNALGYCLGGTLLSVACAILSTTPKENPVNSATFMATMIDFSDVGPMSDIINEELIEKIERGELFTDGILSGHNMEAAFNLIKANDLIWSYYINNYLKGAKPTAFDVMYWTNDNTNLPGDMYTYYMRNIVFENKLKTKNALTICNTQIDINKINCPVFVVSFKEDTISPAKTAFISTELVGGPVEFIIGESGHVMGAINPPSKTKYGHYLNGKLGKGFDEWQKTATRVEGTWWPSWREKLLKLSGKEISSPIKAGNEKYKVIESAPGKFVKEKC
jgi:polyhydroxyalkanoate synthase